MPESDFIALIKDYSQDTITVRAELANSVRTKLKGVTPKVIFEVARLGNAPLRKRDKWSTYDRNFERYLARWAMENHQEATIAMLGSEMGTKLSTEQRLLAIASLSPKNAAIQLVQSIPLMQRPLTQAS